MGAKKISNPEDFTEFLLRFQKNVNSKPLSNTEFKLKFNKDLPGLKNLLNSFSSLSIAQKNIMEWNPFSQRPLCSKIESLNEPTLFTLFDNSAQAIARFVEASHEANHVLLWEPLFTGHSKHLSKTDFINASLAFEGFCFWYADMMVTRFLGVRLPDGEFALSRSSASQAYFHPHRVFKAIGLDDPQKVLDIYLRAFVGGKTELIMHRNKPYVADFTFRTIMFYSTSLKPVRLSFEQLKLIGFFGEFKKRFCDLKGIPTMLPQSILNQNFTSNILQYCHLIATEGHKYIDVLSEKDLVKVRMRRLIQTRAYFAYSLRTALAHDLVFSSTNKKFNAKATIVAINNYIDSLETLIQGLCAGTSLHKLQELSGTFDKKYSESLKSYFVKNDLWMSKRVIIYPEIGTKTCEFGFTTKPNLSLKDIRKLSQTLINRYGSRKMNLVNNKSASQSFNKKFAHFLIHTANVEKKYTKNTVSKWQRAFNNLLKQNDILSTWSIHLGSIDPENNQFRELLFYYD